MERLLSNIIDLESIKPDVLVIATTTGQGSELYLETCKKHGITLVAVSAHPIGNPRWKPFDIDKQRSIQSMGGAVIEEEIGTALLRVGSLLLNNLLPFIELKSNWIEKFLGVGGRVCVQATEIASKKGLVKEGQKIIAMAGKCHAFVFEVNKTKPLQIFLLNKL